MTSVLGLSGWAEGTFVFSDECKVRDLSAFPVFIIQRELPNVDWIFDLEPELVCCGTPPSIDFIKGLSCDCTHRENSLSGQRFLKFV